MKSGVSVKRFFFEKNFFFLLFGIVIFFGFFQNQIHKFSVQELERVESKSEFIGNSIDPQIVKRLLGVRGLFADLIWIDTLIKADVKKEPNPYGAFYRAFSNIVTLDPNNIYAYYVGGLYLSVILDDVKGASALLRAGTEAMSALKRDGQELPAPSWLVPYTLGYNLIFEEHEFEEGSRYVIEAASFEKAPALVRQIAKRVSTQRGRLEVAARILADLRRRLKDEDQRREVEKKMLKVAVEQELLDLNDAFSDFRKTTGAYAFKKDHQLRQFLRSMNHSEFDLSGRRLSLDRFNKIIPVPLKNN